MKKLILSIIIAIMVISIFTACSTQENTEETNNVQTIVEQDNSQSEIVQQTTEQEKSNIVGTYECYDYYDNGNIQATYRIILNSDKTFSFVVESYDSWKVHEVIGTYAEEDSQWILFTCDKALHNYRDTGESEEIFSEEDGNVLYGAVKDSNTLLLENGDLKQKGERPDLDEMLEFVRIN